MTILLALAACTGGGEIGADGLGPMSDYFPYDGERHVTYYGPEELDVLYVDKLEPVESVGDVEVVTFSYSFGEARELLAQLKWASDGEGVRIMSFAEGLGDFTDYDDPIVLAENRVFVGDEFESDPDWLSTYVGPEDVTTPSGQTFEGALHFSLEGEDTWFAGDYWLVQTYGPVKMDVGGKLWELADFDTAR